MVRRRHPRAGGGPAGSPGGPAINNPADIPRLQLRKNKKRELHHDVHMHGGRAKGRPDRRRGRRA